MGPRCRIAACGPSSFPQRSGPAPGGTFTERIDGHPIPLPPQQQTLLNGRPIDQPKKPWWRRLFG
ncbi:hypothetical protein [Janibacter limosus]|uniref:hypothetical protein n=1 Tax=Janibacter limosus TaxID=53458 RepID=UPI000AE3FAC8|nr:hypothetical protein [Janibacter limosus]